MCRQDGSFAIFFVHHYAGTGNFRVEPRMTRQEGMGGRQTQRQFRVAELVRRSLAKLLSQGIPNEPDFQDVSVIVGEVRMSPDLRRATVYVLPLGGGDAEEMTKALNAQSPVIRKMLNRTVTLKRSPALNFAADNLFDQMDDMRRLFDRKDIRRDLAEDPSTPVGT